MHAQNDIPKAEILQGATIVFDLDGTLVDTAPDLVASLNLILAEEGLPALPFDDVRKMVGRGAKALLERGFAAAGAPLDADQAPSWSSGSSPFTWAASPTRAAPSPALSRPWSPCARPAPGWRSAPTS